MKKILISTGIYPPHIGGPAQYAKNLKEAFEKLGHEVKVKTYRVERYLPRGVRHLFFFLKILPALFWSDFAIALDTFSVGVPTVTAGALLKRPVIIRTGGDFLYEQYVERTGKLVLLREFYKTELRNFSWKERIIFRLTHWELARASFVVFNTFWQRYIWAKPYALDLTRTQIIENFYGPKLPSYEPGRKNFIGGARPLKWKNFETLKRTFSIVKQKAPDLFLDLATAPYEQFLSKIQHSYAVILVSLGDISPNMILDALRANKPFILTHETGLYDKLRDVGIFVNPLAAEDIAEKILFLSQPKNYENAKRKIEGFSFTHGWDEIAREFLALSYRL